LIYSGDIGPLRDASRELRLLLEVVVIHDGSDQAWRSVLKSHKSCMTRNWAMDKSSNVKDVACLGHAVKSSLLWRIDPNQINLRPRRWRLNWAIRQHVVPPHRKEPSFAKCRPALETRTQIFKSYLQTV
jgi:hypothetical protein